jgi:hypothetical protein
VPLALQQHERLDQVNGVTTKVREANGYTMTYSFECHSGDTLTEILEGIINNGGILEHVQVI